jgi:two-component system, OmpR family, copper resistance phosphate regulon response regulator CusR
VLGGKRASTRLQSSDSGYSFPICGNSLAVPKPLADATTGNDGSGIQRISGYNPWHEELDTPEPIHFLFNHNLLLCDALRRVLGGEPLRILLVEDEVSAARMLAKGLREQAYAVDLVTDGEEALYRTSINDYDLIILDVMLPRRNGLEVCRQLRAAGSVVPVLMLTARDSVGDRITGLDTGADDYLTKPFDFHELLARVRALLRRGPALRAESIQIADLTIDTQARGVRRAGRRIALTAKEYALLDYLARRADQVVGRADIAEHVWDENFDPFSNLIEVYVQRLRRKIDDGHSRKLLRTVRGEGYMLSAGEDDPHA